MLHVMKNKGWVVSVAGCISVQVMPCLHGKVCEGLGVISGCAEAPFIVKARGK